MGRLRQASRSASMTSLNPSTKRERESEQDEEMEVTSNGKDSSVHLREGSTVDKESSLPDKDASLPDQSAPTSAVDHDEVGESGSNAPPDTNILADDEVTGDLGDDDFNKILEGIDFHDDSLV